ISGSIISAPVAPAAANPGPATARACAASQGFASVAAIPTRSQVELPAAPNAEPGIAGPAGTVRIGTISTAVAPKAVRAAMVKAEPSPRTFTKRRVPAIEILREESALKSAAFQLRVR